MRLITARAKSSARLQNQILLKSSWRILGKQLSPGRSSAQAENPNPGKWAEKYVPYILTTGYNYSPVQYLYYTINSIINSAYDIFKFIKNLEHRCPSRDHFSVIEILVTYSKNVI